MAYPRYMKKELECTQCSRIFLREESQLKYNLKTGRASKSYCSRICRQLYAQQNGTHNKDEYTGFRTLLRSANKRNKYIDLTLEEMKEVWNSQEKICPYTGLILNLYTGNTRKLVTAIDAASLDRIDSSKGYVKSNIQFVSMMANHAKNNQSHQTMVEFCKRVAEHWKEM
jgi:hypothetical protein